MAIIYPNKIPSEVRKDPFRKSEIKIFKILESLDNNFYVFYSVAFQLKVRYNFVSDGEIDFLIFHPNKGFLVIEVKGGKIDYDNISQKWFTTNRYGDRNQIKNPFEQAKSNHYALRTKLQQTHLTKNFNYRTGYAVMFPDCNIQNSNVSFSYDNEIFLDRKQITADTIQKEINKFFHYWHPSHLRTPFNKNPVIKTFAHSWKFESPLLEHIENARHQQLELTEQQYLLINFLNRQRQAKICGCAGSGKTFIAAEKAKRLKEEGFNPIFLCWSKALRNWLNSRLRKLDIPVLTVTEFFRKKERENILYDSIIIDEGQDVPMEYWGNISKLIEDDSIIYIFYDDNQKIYFKGEDTIPILKNQKPYQLSFNCRNTKSIHSLSLPFYRGVDKPESLVKIDRTPELILVKDKLENSLKETLDYLTQKEKIPLRNITILTPRKGERKGPSYPPVKSIFKSPFVEIGEYNIVRESNLRNKNKSVFCSTIQSYKGLENDIIILTELDGIINQKNIEEVLYVGLTRCKGHLIILFDNEDSMKKFNEYQKKNTEQNNA